MAEVLAAVGIAANFAGVIGAGLALSRSLYDFSQVLGSASEDVKSLGTDVSLFCAVLKQVQSTLIDTKIYRLSNSAVDTAQAVLDRCMIIFDDLNSAITKLQGGRTKADFMTRVKWYFKEKRVLLIHEQLKTCGATLHLMLTTLQLARKIANQRQSLNSDDAQDDQDRLMTHSLFVAQQAAVERLAAVEHEFSDEESGEGSNSVPPNTSTRRAPGLNHRRNRSSQIIDGSIWNPISPSGDNTRPLSAILGRHINRLSLAQSIRHSNLSGLDDRRLSILQTDELLRQWTDQNDPLAANDFVPGPRNGDMPSRATKEILSGFQGYQEKLHRAPRLIEIPESYGNSSAEQKATFGRPSRNMPTSHDGPKTWLEQCIESYRISKAALPVNSPVYSAEFRRRMHRGAASKWTSQRARDGRLFKLNHFYGEIHVMNREESEVIDEHWIPFFTQERGWSYSNVATGEVISKSQMVADFWQHEKPPVAAWKWLWYNTLTDEWEWDQTLPSEILSSPRNINLADASNATKPKGREENCQPTSVLASETTNTSEDNTQTHSSSKELSMALSSPQQEETAPVEKNQLDQPQRHAGRPITIIVTSYQGPQALTAEICKPSQPEPGGSGEPKQKEEGEVTEEDAAQRRPE